MYEFHIPTDRETIINMGVRHMEEVMKACFDAGYRFGHYSSYDAMPQSLKDRLITNYDDPMELCVFLHPNTMQITWCNRDYYNRTEKGVPILTVDDLIINAVDFSDLNSVI